MSIALIANLSYVVSAVLFIFGLKMLGSPATARRGNLLSAIGMLIAVIAGLTAEGIVTYEYIIGGIIVGSLIGALAARLIEMTSMPEMVALFNGSGGAASLFVGWSTLYGGEVSTFTAVTILLAILIGGITFTRFTDRLWQALREDQQRSDGFYRPARGEQPDSAGYPGLRVYVRR